MADRRTTTLGRLTQSKGWDEACEGMREVARRTCSHGQTTDEMLHGAYQVAAVESLIGEVERTAREQNAKPAHGVKLV